MILSCTNLMVPGNSLTEQANALRGWGYKGVTVFANHSDWNEEKLEELLGLENNTGIVPCEFLFMSPDAGKLMSENAEERDATKALYTQAAEICAKIGAINEIEYLLGPQNPLPLFDVYKQMTEEQEQRFLSAYRDIAKPVIGTQAAVLLEGINRYESPFMNSIVDCARVAAKLGRKINALACDDAHFNIPGDENRDAFGGWVMVKSDANTPELLLAALKAGHYYSTQGPEILAMSKDGNELVLEFSAAAQVMLVGHNSLSAFTSGQGITQARLPLTRFTGQWGRLVVMDAQGRCAWSNPMWF